MRPFGPNGMLGGDADTDPVLTHRLRAALAELNPEVPVDRKASSRNASPNSPPSSTNSPNKPTNSPPQSKLFSESSIADMFTEHEASQ